ncbi:hypothetical protein GCM10027570_55230 [Streptomonospora sediminis]
MSARRCGRAKRPMRRSVAMENGRRSSWACTTWYIEVQALTSMLIGGSRVWGGGRVRGAGADASPCQRPDRRYELKLT